MSEDCSICGLSLDDEYQHTLSCNHTFHYSCLMKYHSYNKKNNSCPYCRSDCGYLPVISGLKKVIVGVHVKSYEDINNYTINLKCNHIITRGKYKGNKCNKNCLLGYDYCKSHNKK